MILPDYSSLRFRKRPPRIFGEDQLILPYNYDHAVGNDYLSRLRYKVSQDEQYKLFVTGRFRVNGTSNEYAIILTDRLIYIVILKKYDVKKCTEIHLHKLKMVEVERQEPKEEFSVEIFTHVPVMSGKTSLKISRLAERHALEIVEGIRSVMAALKMEIEVRAQTTK